MLGLLNSNALHDGEGDALPALGDVLLGEGEGTVRGQKVAEHAREDAAVEAIALLGGVGRALDQLPLVLVGQRAALLGLVLVPEVLHQPLEVAIAVAGHGIVELDALLGHVDDRDGPVHAGHVNCGVELPGKKVIGIGNVDFGK